MPRYGRQVDVTGGSGLADLIDGFIGGYGTGQQFRSQREAENLAREREARYAAEAAAQAEDRRLARARQAAVDVQQYGLYNADALGGPPPEELVTRPEDLRQAAAGDAIRGGLIDTAPTVRLGGQEMGRADDLTPDSSGYNRINRYSEVAPGLYRDVQFDPNFKAEQAAATERNTGIQDQRAMRALSSYLGEDAGNLGALAGAGINPNVAFQMGQSRVNQTRETEQEQAALRGWQALAQRYGIADADQLTGDQLEGEVTATRGFQNAARLDSVQAANDLRVAREKAAIAQEGQPDYDPKRAASLRTEFRIRTSDFQKQAAALGRIEAATSAADPQGADDVALIFNYMKLLDPTSVVRESEYATAANVGVSVPEQVRRQYNKALEGKVLTQKQRDDIVASARRQGAGARRQLQEMSSYYGGLAAQEGIPSDAVVFDYFSQVGGDGTADAEALKQRYQSRVRELVSGGMPPDQAKAKARAEMDDSE